MLFCQLRNHGDIIRTFPLLDAIKYYHPDWYIGYTCFENMVETCKSSKSIDVIISQPRFSPVIDTQGGTRILDCSIFQNCVEKVREKEFDIYIDLHGVFQSAMFGAMCGVKRRLGRSKETSKDGATLFYTDICDIKSKEINRMERHFIVFNKLFPEVRPITNYKDCDFNGKVVIFPGSSKKGILKRWETEYYAELGKKISKKSKVVYILGPEEQDIYPKLASLTTCEIKLCCSWDEIEKELRDSKLAIGNDGAYVHFSVWKNIPAIIICGPLSPKVNGIWKYGIGETIFNKNTCECPNLWKGICNEKHKCLDQISVEDVMKLVKKYMR